MELEVLHSSQSDESSRTSEVADTSMAASDSAPSFPYALAALILVLPGVLFWCSAALYVMGYTAMFRGLSQVVPLWLTVTAVAVAPLAAASLAVFDLRQAESRWRILAQIALLVALALLACLAVWLVDEAVNG